MLHNDQHIIELLNAEKTKLFNYANYRLRDIKDVEDALQNVYLKVLSDSARFKKVENKRAYIFRILCNECNDFIRRSAKANAAVDINSISSLAIASLQPENFEEEFALINGLLNALPPEQSETIRLHLHAEMTFPEIADMMDIPLPTAKARYRYGIEKLRTRLKTMNLI